MQLQGWSMIASMEARIHTDSDQAVVRRTASRNNLWLHDHHWRHLIAACIEITELAVYWYFIYYRSIISQTYSASTAHNSHLHHTDVCSKRADSTHYICITDYRHTTHITCTTVRITHITCTTVRITHTLYAICTVDNPRIVHIPWTAHIIRVAHILHTVHITCVAHITHTRHTTRTVHSIHTTVHASHHIHSTLVVVYVMQCPNFHQCHAADQVRSKSHD